jgi:hypothetical protein
VPQEPGISHEKGAESMIDPARLADEKRAEANRLYWEDERSVEALALLLGMSRAAMYACVDPLPAGVVCLDCGADAAYPNRSHRASGRVRCTDCGAEAANGDDAARDEPLGAASKVPAADEARLERWRQDLAAVDGQRKRLIGGGAALGVLAGIAAVAAVRELK